MKSILTIALSLFASAASAAQAPSVSTGTAVPLDGQPERRVLSVRAGCARDAQQLCSWVRDEKDIPSCLDGFKERLSYECREARDRSGNRFRDEQNWTGIRGSNEAPDEQPKTP